jgi:hypothetical protein
LRPFQPLGNTSKVRRFEPDLDRRNGITDVPRAQGKKEKKKRQPRSPETSRPPTNSI